MLTSLSEAPLFSTQFHSLKTTAPSQGNQFRYVGARSFQRHLCVSGPLWLSASSTAQQRTSVMRRLILESTGSPDHESGLSERSSSAAFHLPAPSHHHDPTTTMWSRLRIILTYTTTSMQ